MKSTRASGMLGLLALAVSPFTLAAADDSGWYVGANIGQSKATIDDERIKRALFGGGLTTTSMARDETEFGYKLFGGYQFNRHFALEGGYFDLGEFGFDATTAPTGSLSGDTTVKGLDLDVFGILPIDGKLSAFARGGLTYVGTESSFNGSGAVTPPPSRDKRAAGYKYGLGLQWDFNHALGMRLEAERYRIDDAIGNDGDVDHFSLGLVYRFFGKAPPPAKAAAPAPYRGAPVLVIAPAPPRTAKYCSILDIQFEINADEIQREEKERLAVVGAFMNKYPDTTALVEGHSDNVGTPEHNKELSQRRAETVASYLSDTFKIAPSRLKAVGYGETRPLADNSTQEGQRMNRRIGTVISCARDIEGLVVVPARITIALDMEFDARSAAIKPEYRDELRKLASFLKANPSVTATVEGHTANLQATPALAMEMSYRRAQNVVNYLVDEFAVPRTQLNAEGFGETRRFAYNTDVEGQQDNRRINVILNYAK